VKQSQVLPWGLQKLEQHCTLPAQPAPRPRHPQIPLTHEPCPAQHSASALHCAPGARQHVPPRHVPLQHDCAPR
jgi:hypothetical protein